MFGVTGDLDIANILIQNSSLFLSLTLGIKYLTNWDFTHCPAQQIQ